MSKLQPPLVAILVALVILAGCSSVPTDEDVAASVEARLAVAQTETMEAVTSERVSRILCKPKIKLT